MSNSICAMTLFMACMNPHTLSAQANPNKPADEVGRRLAELERLYLEALDRDVLKAHTAALQKLNADYTGALDQALVAATKAEKLPEALALRDEKKRITDQKPLPANDADSPPAELARLRKSYEASLTRLTADRDRKMLPIQQKYEAVLREYQNSLTREGKLDEAALVAERMKALPQQNYALANNGKPAMAKVKVEDCELTPFRKGVNIFGDRDRYKWDVLPEEFADHRFWRSNITNAPRLDFKVITDGKVFMACTDRWNNSGSGSNLLTDLTSQAKLEEQGWKLEPGKTAKATNEPHQWLIFSRDCKAGESFSIRTEKYSKPILLVD